MLLILFRDLGRLESIQQSAECIPLFKKVGAAVVCVDQDIGNLLGEPSLHGAYLFESG